MTLRKKLVFKLIVILFICNYTFAQEINNFSLSGKININETKYLTISNGFISSDFSEFSLQNNENEVKDKNFIIEGRIEYPHAFRFITNTGEISGLFFLDKSTQTTQISELDLNDYQLITGSKTNYEYINNYIPLVKNLLIEDNRLKNSWNDSISEFTKTKIRAGRKRIRNEKNKILLQYIKENPDSYVGMWLFAENFSIYGYNAIHENMYNSMSDKLKNTYCGQGLNKKLKIARISSINGYLPNTTLLEFKGTEKNIQFDSFESKYLLVDFWASYCAPCIKQFPYLLELYNNTSRDFFNVIAISIDEGKTIKNWNSFLQKQSFPWKQYLDENGFAKQIFINSVPANFLLNRKGQIILRDFTVDELKEFLELEETEN